MIPKQTNEPGPVYDRFGSKYHGTVPGFGSARGAGVLSARCWPAVTELWELTAAATRDTVRQVGHGWTYRGLEYSGNRRD